MCARRTQSLSSLDYWVSRAEHARAPQPRAPLIVLPYSTDPKLAEPIMSREGIVVTHVIDAEFGDKFMAMFGYDNDAGAWLGKTALEAAMRLYVARRFGSEVACTPIDREDPSAELS